MASSSSSADIDPARLVRLGAEKVLDVSSPFFPHHYSATAPGSVLHYDPAGPWDLSAFRKHFVAKVTRLSSERIEFDLIGLDASIANAIRRVMIAEVPTIAIEDVYVVNNTSIIQDEVLAHRLGLIPLKIDPDMLQWRNKGEGVDPSNTLIFVLHTQCKKKPGVSSSSRAGAAGKGKAAKSMDVDASSASGSSGDVNNLLNPLDALYDNTNVYSSQLTFMPDEAQQEWSWVSAVNPSGEKPRPVHEKILIAKLRPGQEIRVEMHCCLGIGKDHAKFSPVATASYRLLPHIQLLEPIGEDFSKTTQQRRQEQLEFAKCFAPGVIGIRPKGSKGVEASKAKRSGKSKGKASASADAMDEDISEEGETEVYVKDPRRDTVSREVLRDERFKDKVKLGRVRDHFLFDVETSGALPPERLMLSAIKVLVGKIDTLAKALDELEEPRT